MDRKIFLKEAAFNLESSFLIQKSGKESFLTTPGLIAINHFKFTSGVECLPVMLPEACTDDGLFR